jgi:hypothetical protein
MKTIVIAASAVLAGVLLPACSSSSSSSPSETSDTGSVESSETGASETAESLTYPPPPYGVNVGDTFPDATWDGFRSGTTDAVKISSIDYYDPKGERGIRAVGIFFSSIPQKTGGTTCTDCDQIFAALSSAMTSSDYDWKTRGVRILEVATRWNKPQIDVPALLAARGPSSALDEAVWVFGHDAAGGITWLPPFEKVGFPSVYVVDPRTMKIVHVLDSGGAGTGDPTAKFVRSLEIEAVDNGAPPKP